MQRPADPGGILSLIRRQGSCVSLSPPSVSPFVSLVLLLSCCGEDFEHIAELSEISLGGIKFEKIEAVEGIALDGSRKKGGKRCSNSGRRTADFKKSMITPARSRPISERERDVLLKKWASCSRVIFRCPFAFGRSPAKSG